jgi:hypothetical protein
MFQVRFHGRGGHWPVLKQIEGSRAVAEAMATSRSGVICAYPITAPRRRRHLSDPLRQAIRTKSRNIVGTMMHKSLQ